MNLIEFLQDLSMQGVALWLDGDSLRSRAPEGVLTPELLNKMRQQKAEIRELLSQGVDISKTYPLSIGQKALWFLYELEPSSSAYNMAITVRICSQLDVVALKRAWVALVAAHPLLRTTFTKIEGTPRQKIHGLPEVDFEQIDASSWTADELKKRVREAYHQPWDLGKGVSRFRVFTPSPKDHVVLITIHHIAGDAWSMWMLFSELGGLYQGETTNRALELPVQKNQYPDYMNWQLQLLNSSKGEELWNYWQKQLVGGLPVINLPTDRPRPPVQTFNGSSHFFKLSEELSKKLRELARSEGATLYMVLLAAFFVLLHRYSGQSDILVGSPTSGRSKPEWRRIFGYFVNPVVLRGNLSGNHEFKAFLKQVRQTVLGEIAHQDYPFPLLVERLQPKRNPSYSPIFQVLFVFQKPQQEFAEFVELFNLGGNITQIDWGGLSVAPFEMAQMEGQLDLALQMMEASGELVGDFKYNTDLFDASTIARMAGHFQVLLSGLVANPERHIGESPLLTKAQQQQMLVEWNDTATSYPSQKCIHQLFSEQVSRTPDAIAVVFEEEELTYRELNSRANQLAHYLQKLGVGPEVLVGICVERSLEMVVGLLGILKAGGAYVPLDPTYPQERLAYMLSDSSAQVLLTIERLVEGLPEHKAFQVRLDTDWGIISEQNDNNPVSTVKPDNLAYVIYTSGTTGKPKGTMILHQGLVNYLSWATKTYAVAEGGGAPVNSSLSFDATITSLFSPWLVGQKVVLLPEKDEIEALSACLLHTNNPNNFSLVKITPAHLEVLSHSVEKDNTRSGTKALIVGGEALRSYRVSCWRTQLPSTRIINEYGPTETVVGCGVYEVTDATKLKYEVPIGRPIDNTQIYILDRHLQPVPIGVPGELHIGGAGLARGYLNRPELTADKFIPNPFSNEPGARIYKTGDLARYLPDANIFFIGRIDNQVKIRSFRIELPEIEAVLTQHPSVAEAIVIVREEEQGNKGLVAYLVAKEEQPAISDLRSFLLRKLPDYMVPNAFVFLEVMPLTPNGKIDRRALPAPDTSQRSSEAGLVLPRDILEMQLTQIWSDVLGVHPIGVRDNFFELGGHSLLAVQLMAQIEQQFGANLLLGTLFQTPTIEQLASLLRDGTESTPKSPLVPIQPKGNRRPFFGVPGAGGNVIYFYDLAHHLGNDQPFYAFQAVGLDGKSKPHNRCEDMAAHYIEALQTVQPQGPYQLGGHSLGGLVAFGATRSGVTE